MVERINTSVSSRAWAGARRSDRNPAEKRTSLGYEWYICDGVPIGPQSAKWSVVNTTRFWLITTVARKKVNNNCKGHRAALPDKESEGASPRAMSEPGTCRHLCYLKQRKRKHVLTINKRVRCSQKTKKIITINTDKGEERIRVSAVLDSFWTRRRQPS